MLKLNLDYFGNVIANQDCTETLIRACMVPGTFEIGNNAEPTRSLVEDRVRVWSLSSLQSSFEGCNI
jgi:hypothetical protein